MSQSVGTVYEFGAFRLDPVERVLMRDDSPVPLTPKLFDTLTVLIRNSGHTVTKDELMTLVWPNTFVDEGTLTRTVSRLRRALGEETNGHRYIETVPRFGYRFLAEVRESAADGGTVWEGIGVRAALASQRITKQQTADLEDLGTGVPDWDPAEPPGMGTVRPGEADAAPESVFIDTESPASPLIQGKQTTARRARARLFAARRAVGALLLLAGSVAAIAFAVRSHSNLKRTAPEVKTLAVLPFKQLGPSGADEYLGLGLADALITRLGNLREIKVRPTSAVQNLAGDDRDPASVGRALGVDAVLDGRVQKIGDAVRVTVQLVSSKDGSPIWAEKFDEGFNSVFAAQDAVARRVISRLAPVLTPKERESQARHSTDSPEAYEAYLKGRYFWNKRTTEGFRKSIDYFQQAIQKDPNFALAYAGLADAYSMDAMPKAEPALRKALELDDSLGEAHASLGFYRTFWQCDWSGAEEEFKQAIEMSPNYSSAYQWYALSLAAQGRFEEAKAEMALALELEPLSPNMNTDMAQIYYYARQYDEAMAACQKVLDIDPDFSLAHNLLLSLYVQKGMHPEAVQEFLKQEERNGFATDSWWAAYQASGWRGFLQSVLRSKTFAHDPIFRSQLGDKKALLDDLEALFDDQYLWIKFIKVEPAYDQIRDEPRFQKMLRRIRLGT
jgi:DNA-binding winged helix-turn-helix (wHTH) protein/TolB-like protein